MNPESPGMRPQESFTPPISEALKANEDSNGSFLSRTDARAASSPLGAAVEAVAHRYIYEGELAFALRNIQTQHLNVLSDYWRNSALQAFEEGTENTGFDDTTSNGQPVTREAYLEEYSGTAPNPVNEDERFPSLRPRGFEIAADAQPVMAIVALDPKAIEGKLDVQRKAALLDEVNALRVAIMGNGETEKEFSPELTAVLSECLLANSTFISTDAPDGSPARWKLPYDKIASLKALYPLLSDQDSSAAMRQGAIRMTNENGQEIIVGSSGLNSAIDEMVSRNFATETLAQADSIRE